MNDYYGKTRRSYKNRTTGPQICQQLGQIFSDAGNPVKALTKRTVAVPAVLLVANSFLCYFLASAVPALLISFVVALCGSLIVFARRPWREARPAIMILCCMLCAVLVYSGTYISSRLNAAPVDPDVSEYACTVTESSCDLSGNIDLTVRLEGGALAKVNYYGDPVYESMPVPGDRLVIQGKLKIPDRAGNPGEFDYREYLRSKGILYVITCKHCDRTGKAGFPLKITEHLHLLVTGIREKAFEAVAGSYDEPNKALLAAVCLGDRSMISGNVSRDFELSCCSHLLAVSGTHFAGFTVCLPFVLNSIGAKRKHAFIVQCIFCILIGCLTGWSDSVTRAAIMSLCVYADRDWLSALSLSAVVMVLADPFSPLSSGFQMSFCAVLAIKVYGKRIKEFLTDFHMGEKLAGCISASVSAAMGLIPFWSDISMRPDIEHLAIQIAGSSVASLACTCFVPSLLLCLLLPFLSQFLSRPLLLCLKALEALVKTGGLLSRQGGAPVHLSKTFLAVSGLVLFLVMSGPCMMKRILLKPAAFFLAIVIGTGAVDYFRKPVCTVVFADVGQGDCCLIMTEDKTCLIDGGTFDEGSKAVCGLLDYYGISRVDVCVMSHWDADHAGGIAALCESGRTECILTSFVPCPEEPDKEVAEFYKATGLCKESREKLMSQLVLFAEGDCLYLSEEVRLDALYPASGTGGGNDDSLVTMLNIDKTGTSILFTGDISTKVEEHLIGAGTDIDCDILKVAHHGSRYSTSEEFIEAASPEMAVISVGANNFYGHPAPETVERLEQYGCKVFRTDEEGAVILRY